MPSVRSFLQPLGSGGRVVINNPFNGVVYGWESCSGFGAIGMKTPRSEISTPSLRRTFSIASSVSAWGFRTSASKWTIVRGATRHLLANSAWVKPRPARAALQCLPVIKILPIANNKHIWNCALNTHYRIWSAPSTNLGWPWRCMSFRGFNSFIKKDPLPCVFAFLQ